MSTRVRNNAFEIDMQNMLLLGKPFKPTLVAINFHEYVIREKPFNEIKHEKGREQSERIPR